MKAPLITVENLCMDFDGERVLKNISFEIAEGEILGIIGRSGAGKTVLMHLMRGVEQPPTSGKIIYHMAVCGGCAYIDVGSAAGQALPALRRHHDRTGRRSLEREGRDPPAPADAPDRHHVPAHLRPVRRRPGHRECPSRSRRYRISRPNRPSTVQPTSSTRYGSRTG